MFVILFHKQKIIIYPNHSSFLHSPSLNRKLLIASCSNLACSDKSSLVEAVSSAVAELFCTTTDTWSIPWLIWAIPEACSFDAWAISATRAAVWLIAATISCRDDSVSWAILLPLSTFASVDSIYWVVSLAASALLAARFLTSSATTAKPLPCWPALAASTAALSARILVWKAISSNNVMI